MALKAPEPVRYNAILQLGLPTVILPSKTYRRVITSVDVVNSLQCSCVLYRGSPNGAFVRITGISIAQSNTYNSPWSLPSNQNAFVVFSAVGAGGASDANAAFSWVESA